MYVIIRICFWATLFSVFKKDITSCLLEKIYCFGILGVWQKEKKITINKLVYFLVRNIKELKKNKPSRGIVVPYFLAFVNCFYLLHFKIIRFWELLKMAEIGQFFFKTTISTLGFWKVWLKLLVSFSLSQIFKQAISFLCLYRYF